MVPGVPCVDRGNWGRERDIARSWQSSVFWEESFGKYRAYTFISRTKMPIFSRKGRSSSYILESQPRKLMLETFPWDNNVNWVDGGTGKNRQSMTSCGFCSYYLEHCSKTNHIAIKWTKYENVYGLVTSHKIWWSPNFLRLSVTCVTRTRRVEYETKRNKKTEWHSLPYKPWFNKNM